MSPRKDRRRPFGAALALLGALALHAGFAHAQRLDQLYMLQPHNTYAHGARLDLWLSAGYRTVELDVQDQGSWWVDPRGPYVAHDGGPVDGNCRTTADRLGDCLDDIVSWQNLHPGELPIIVFVDMKTRLDNALSAWDASKIDALDAFVAGRLGSRQYRYSDLRSAVDLGASQGMFLPALANLGLTDLHAIDFGSEQVSPAKSSSVGCVMSSATSKIVPEICSAARST